MSPRRARVLVVGDGIAALASARAMTRRGFGVCVVGRRLPGAASAAAAGLLAPSLGEAAGGVRELLRRARDLWPEFAAALARDSGHPLAVNRLGILELALDREAFARAAAHRPTWGEVLEQGDLALLEPALAHLPGAILHPGDGAVDNQAALAALDAACERDPAVVRVGTTVRRIELGTDRVVALGADGSAHHCDLLVLAAGAWTTRIDGLPTPLPVVPRRGQMLALDAAPVGHCLAGAGVYVVPRGERTLVGSTMEDVGFDVATTDEAITGLRRGAEMLVPQLASAPELARWAGLRPMSPDALPLLGNDPADRRVIHAAGLSKNGILLAPLVAEAVAALASGEDRPELAPFAIGRLAG